MSYTLLFFVDNLRYFIIFFLIKPIYLFITTTWQREKHRAGLHALAIFASYLYENSRHRIQGI